QPQHAAIAREQRLFQKHTKWRDTKRDQQEAEDPVAGAVGDEFNRVRRQRERVVAPRGSLVGTPKQTAQRDQAKAEQSHLRPLACEQLVHWLITALRIPALTGRGYEPAIAPSREGGDSS